MTESDFLDDEKTQSAVIRELEVIGEATKRISDNYKIVTPKFLGSLCLECVMY